MALALWLLGKKCQFKFNSRTAKMTQTKPLPQPYKVPRMLKSECQLDRSKNKSKLSSRSNRPRSQRKPTAKPKPEPPRSKRKRKLQTHQTSVLETGPVEAKKTKASNSFRIPSCPDKQPTLASKALEGCNRKLRYRGRSFTTWIGCVHVKRTQ